LLEDLDTDDRNHRRRLVSLLCTIYRTAHKKHLPGVLDDLRAFLQERWRGERPVLWHSQIMQAELKEAFYCGSFDLESHGGRQ